MLILTIRTDKPEAEIGLFSNNQKLDYKIWLAHRELSRTILTNIEHMLKTHTKNWQHIEGIVFYKGPGSFTGLRIGASVANALAADRQLPVIGQNGQDWLNKGIKSLLKGDTDRVLLPFYGEATITTPQKK